jgi:hypothetical protein
MSYENVYPKIVCLGRGQNNFRKKRTTKIILSPQYPWES